MPKGAKYGGRVKGTPNKNTKDVREVIMRVFDGVGGIEHMKEWAKTNPTEFYKIYSKLLPRDIKVSGALTLEDLVVGKEPDGDGETEAD